MERKQPKKPSEHVTEARASAQRAKLDAQDEARRQATEKTSTTQQAQSKHQQKDLLAKRRARATIGHAIADYLLDHEGGNHSDKTLQWHKTALGLLQSFLQEERGITLIGEVDAPDINAWFAYMRKTPSSRGKVRSERTIQTYARSARAFFHWLVRRETIERNPFDRVVFPKVGKPLIRPLNLRNLNAFCWPVRPPGEVGQFADRAAARNRAILWILYDTGIRLSELCGLRTGDFDRKHALIIVCGKGSKERRIALGNNCLRNLFYYLDRHRPDEEELAEWGSAGEDHLFLAETRRPLTNQWRHVALCTHSKTCRDYREAHQPAHFPPFLRNSLPGAGQ